MKGRRIKVKPGERRIKKTELISALRGKLGDIEEIKYKFGLRSFEDPDEKKIVYSPDMEKALVTLKVSQTFITNVNDIPLDGKSITYGIYEAESVFLYDKETDKLDLIFSVITNEKPIQTMVRNYYETAHGPNEGKIVNMDNMIFGKGIESIVGFEMQNRQNKTINDFEIVCRLVGGTEIKYSLPLKKH